MVTGQWIWLSHLRLCKTWLQMKTKEWVHDKVMRACSTLHSLSCFYSSENAATALQNQEKPHSTPAHRSPSGLLHHPALLLLVIFVLAMLLQRGYEWSHGQSYQGERYLGVEAWTSLKSHCVSVDGAVRAFSVFREDGNTEAFHSQLAELVKKQSAGPDPKHQDWMCSSYNARQILQLSLQSVSARRAVAT